MARVSAHLGRMYPPSNFRQQTRCTTESVGEYIHPTSTAARPIGVLAVFMGLLLSAGGCGYQHNGSLDNANGYSMHTLYADDVKTIAVPIFGNRTYWRGVEFSLSKAVVNAVESQTPYKVVERASADTVLEGEIEGVFVHTISNDPNTSEPQEQVYDVSVNFTWTDLRTGKIRAHRQRFTQTAPYYPTLGESRFVGDQLNVERLALAIVEALQADWGNAGQDAPPPALEFK